ncbi:LPXTG-motif cell wall anchor domain-containing protein/fimbrial isopeptide formation D2 domain-containing protein [Sarcina sp. DSM 11001]|nr:LPXTG-motif cell wall anchor domain-containing protein/fimbrial isopeptide formation D2 domain-containing protein [Sarcina sp. DSM 11001]
MVLSMGAMTAFAADPTGSITIQPSETVTLANKTLKAYRILDATYGEGELPDQPVSYTIPAKMQSFYDEYFSTGTGASKKTASDLAEEAGITADQYVAEQIAALTTAQLKDFEYAALAAAKTAGVTANTGSLSGSNYVFSALPAGYYVIEDEGEGVPISALMLDTVTDADVEINLKAEDKSTKEIMTAEELVNSKANELGLGRAVNYKITQEIPDYTGYDYYYYLINDTLSSGLTFNPDSVVVKVTKPAVPEQPAVTVAKDTYADGEAAEAEGFALNTSRTGDEDYWIKAAVPAQEAVTTTLVKGADYYLYYDNGAEAGDAEYDEDIATILNGKTFIIAFNDVVASNKIDIGYGVEVTYTATVNSDAVVGVDPNNNKASVEYSNNPDKDGKGDFDEDHPGIPANDGNHPTGVGPDKYTDTYTTKVTIKKIDGTTEEALEGVEFTLKGTAKDAVFNAEKVFEIDPDGTYWLLNDGTYTTTAPTTAATVRETTGGAGWVEIGAEEEVTATVPVRVVGDTSYRPYVEATDSAKTRYVIVEPNDADYASTTTKYSLVTKTADDAEEYTVERTGVTAIPDGETDAIVDFAQLGAGTYTLSETGVLAGYNGLQDIEFTLTCNMPDAEDVIAGTEKATWTAECTDDSIVQVEFVENKDEDENGLGTFVITIENNKGTELPSTGGIGTTIFYIVGAILVIGAGVILITKRRMDA